MLLGVFGHRLNIAPIGKALGHFVCRRAFFSVSFIVA